MMSVVEKGWIISRLSVSLSLSYWSLELCFHNLFSEDCPRKKRGIEPAATKKQVKKEHPTMTDYMSLELELTARLNRDGTFWPWSGLAITTRRLQYCWATG